MNLSFDDGLLLMGIIMIVNIIISFYIGRSVGQTELQDKVAKLERERDEEMRTFEQALLQIQQWIGMIEEDKK